MRLTTAMRWKAKRQPSMPKGIVEPMLVAKKPPIMPPAAQAVHVSVQMLNPACMPQEDLSFVV